MPEVDPDKPWDGNLTLGSLQGPWVGPAKCLQEHAIGNRPPIPFGEENAKQDMSALVEDGFKTMRGQPSEGRYVVFQIDDFALTNNGDGSVGIGNGNAKHDKIEQRWILHGLADYGKDFYLQSAKDKTYIAAGGKLTKNKSKAQKITINYYANDAGYTLSAGSKGSLTIEVGVHATRVKRAVNWSGGGTKFTAYAVSYKS